MYVIFSCFIRLFAKMNVNLNVNSNSMKHSVKFSPEKRKDKSGCPIVENVPIFADIRYSGTRFYYFTGFRIDLAKWDTVKQEAHKNSMGREGTQAKPYNLINQRIKGIRAALELYFQNTDTPDKAKLIHILNGVGRKESKPTPSGAGLSFVETFQKYITTKNIARQKKNRTLLGFLIDYTETNGQTLSFATFTPEVCRDFEKYLSAIMGRNSMATYMKALRTFWHWNNKERAAIKQPPIPSPFTSYKVPPETYGKPIYITTEERDRLHDADIQNDRLRHIRDIFVFQCFTGARVGDMCRFTAANIQGGLLTYIPLKTKGETGEAVSLPLHPKALEILSRYDMPDGRLLPFISDQRYNDYIKELFELCGITRTVTRLNPRTGNPEQVRICDIASSHMARRAFIGNLYGKVDRDTIGSMSGHVKGSKAFSRYYDVDENLKKQAISLL